MEYKSEEEFLKNYNPEQFKRISMTTDILVLSVSSILTNNYRKTDKKVMSVLLVKRSDYPFKGKWCLPGGFLKYDEDLEDAPKRILKSETNLDNIYLEQLYTFGNPLRDPRMRIVSTSYLSLIDKNKITSKLNENASWFDISVIEENNKVDIYLSNGECNVKINARKKFSNGVESFEIIENNDLAFDHALVLVTGIERLKNKINYTDIVFNMMPEYFTLGELQQVYEVILNKKLLDPAFRRIIEPKVVKTNKMKTGEGHRPSYLYKYKKI